MMTNDRGRARRPRFLYRTGSLVMVPWQWFPGNGFLVIALAITSGICKTEKNPANNQTNSLLL